MTLLSHKVQRFLSLKWKALILFSMVLFVINASFPFFSHQNLMEHYDQRREAEHAHFTKEFDGLMEHMLKRSLQFSEVIPLLDGVEESLVSGKNETIRLAFDGHWSLLQLDMGIDLVRFHSVSGRELGRWGHSTFIAEEELLITGWIEEVIRKERPITALSCIRICTQYVMAPLLSEGEKIGIILLGSSLAEVIINLQQISGREIGVLIDRKGEEIHKPSENLTQGRMISSWNKEIIALTNMNLTLPLLRSVVQKIPSFDDIIKGKKVGFENRNYELGVIPLQGLANPGAGHLIVIDDISKTLLEIRRATRKSLIAGIIGLLFSEGILLAILWTPISRLRLITETLPLLAQGKFKQVRRAFSTRPQSLMKDEIDILDDAAIALSHQLEMLETEVKIRTKTLAARMEDLAHEKDFIAHLLDTARVIILTQDKDGKLMMLNQHACHITGYKRNELTGMGFADLFSEGDLTIEMMDDLGRICSGQREYVSHESVITCKNRSLRHIVWVHSRLARKKENEPVILSVGLDFTARKQAELRLSWLADHDPLTSLFNRRRFQSELENILAKSKKSGQAGALFYFDLDQFKYVNDTQGHHAGDTLLKVIASQLFRFVRTTDIVGRLGGDEFAIVVSEINETGALQIAHKITQYLDNVEVSVLGPAFKISASIGIVLFPAHGETLQELLSNADLAMYQAKEKGQGSWHLFTGYEPIRARMKEQVYWKDRIKQALDNDLFVMYFQPVRNIHNGSIFCYEALIRMRDQDETLISPAAFIPIAEESGLIYEIDHLVLDKVISRQAALSAQGIHLTFTLNLSGYAFNDPALLSHLKRTLTETGANPENIVIEITETAAVSDLVAACCLMNEIKDLGCSFALDDFGTGFASFNYLKELPVDIVKIGDTFIKEIVTRPDDQIFVKSLTEVTKGLGKKTIAEGVENAEILSLLKEYAVDFAQGWHVGKPVSKLLEEGP